MKFAEHRERNGLGHIIYPRDEAYRRQLGFVEESFQHPAKANLYLIEELVEYCSSVDQHIVDITAGTGSILVACLSARHVTCVELNPKFASMIAQSASSLGIKPEHYTILNSDCREQLPITCDTIIFSPPYANMLKAGGGILNREKLGDELHTYSEDNSFDTNPKNLGVLPEFRFAHAMTAIYRKCWDSLPPGGKMALIIKDQMKQQKVVPLGWHHMQILGKAGWKLDTWEQWDAPGMQFKNIHKSHGHKVIEGEHIIIVRKP